MTRPPTWKVTYELRCKAEATLAREGWPVDAIAILTGKSVATIYRDLRMVRGR